MTISFNSDILLERLRERVVERGDDYNRGYCQNCVAQITTTDVEAGECSNCSALLVDDESVDEHLHEDDGDY